MCFTLTVLVTELLVTNMQQIKPSPTSSSKKYRDIILHLLLLTYVVRLINVVSYFYDIMFLHVAAAYTYYKSLCQEESLKRKGTYAQRKVQRRRRERVVRVSSCDRIISIMPMYSTGGGMQQHYVFLLNFSLNMLLRSAL